MNAEDILSEPYDSGKDGVKISPSNRRPDRFLK